MAKQTLGEALARLNLTPMPPTAVLDGMDEDERDRAIRASFVTDLTELPGWYRRKIETWAAEAIARAEAKDAMRRLP